MLMFDNWRGRSSAWLLMLPALGLLAPGCADEKRGENSVAANPATAPASNPTQSEIVLLPTRTPGSQRTVTLSESTHTLTGVNLSMTDLLCLAYRQPEAARGRLPLMSAARVLSDRALPGGGYDVRVYIPNASAAQLRAALGAALARSFTVAGRRALIETDVLLLVPKGFSPGDAARRLATESDTLVEASLSGSESSLLVEQLEERLGLPVVDESGRKGGYELRLNWASAARGDAASRPDLVSVRRALQEQLELDLIAAKRVVEMVLVDGAGR